MNTGYKILFGVIYSLVYAFLAIALINPEGTGSGIFLIPLITWFFLLVVLYLFGRLESSRNRIFFIVFMLAHYITNFVLAQSVWNHSYWDISYKGKSRLTATWEHEPSIIFFLITWYLLGQLIIWIIFYKEVKNVGNVET
jgi:hypothetical protein